MQLGDAEVQEFAALWREEFGETLSPEEARCEASRLLTLYAALARREPGNDDDSRGKPSP
jgi:hypothetical protein